MNTTVRLVITHLKFSTIIYGNNKLFVFFTFTNSSIFGSSVFSIAGSLALPRSCSCSLSLSGSLSLPLRLQADYLSRAPRLRQPNPYSSLTSCFLFALIPSLITFFCLTPFFLKGGPPTKMMPSCLLEIAIH